MTISVSRHRVFSRSSYLYLFVSIILLSACDRGPTNDIERQESAPGETNTAVREEVQWPVGGDLVYVSNEDSGDISIISTASNQVIKTLSVGRRPRGIRVDHTGEKVFVALSGSPKCPPSMSDEDCNKQSSDKTKDGIAVIDVRTGNLERVLPGGSDPEQFDLSADNRRLFVSNEDADQVTVVDIESGQILQTIAVGREPEGVRVIL